MSSIHLPAQPPLDSVSSTSIPCPAEASKPVLDTQSCWEASWTTPSSEASTYTNVQLSTTAQHQAPSEGSLAYIADYLTPSSTSSDDSSAALSTPSSAFQITPNTSYSGKDSSKQGTIKTFHQLDEQILAAVTLQTYALMSGEGAIAPHPGSSITRADLEPPLAHEMYISDPFTRLFDDPRSQQELITSTGAHLPTCRDHRLQDWCSLANTSTTGATASILDRIIGSCTSSHSHRQGYEASADVQSAHSDSTESYEQGHPSSDPKVLVFKSSIRPGTLAGLAAAYADAQCFSLALMGKVPLLSSNGSYLVHLSSGRRISLVESACVSPESSTSVGQASSSSSATSTSESYSSVMQKEAAEHTSNSSPSGHACGQPKHSDNVEHSVPVMTYQRLIDASEDGRESSSSPSSSDVSQDGAEAGSSCTEYKRSELSAYEREKASREYEYLTAIVLPAENAQELLPYSTKTEEDPRRVPSRQDFQGDDNTKALAQEPKLGSGDLYTPKFVKGHKSDRQGWCDCGKWFGMKSSVYNYHASICHGISCRTGRPFAPPIQIRWCKALRMVDAHCHNCGEWVNIMRKMMRHRTWKNWFVHASHCHHKAVRPKSSALQTQTQPAAVESVAGPSAKEREQPAKKRSSGTSALETLTPHKRFRKE